MSVLAEAGWTEGLFELASFTLESGQTIAPLRLSYATIGSPRPDGSNGVVLLPSASGVKHWAVAHVSHGSTIDPAEHFVVTVDTIGGGASTRPSELPGSRFPPYGMRDNARAVHALVTQALHLPGVKAAGGPSMGAMIALELGLCFPAFSSGLFLWSPASRCSAMFEALARLMRALLALDPAYRDGKYERPPTNGLFVAGMAYFLPLVGRGFLDAIPAQDRLSISQSVGRAFAQQWDANDLLSRYESLTQHDVRNRPSGPDEAILTRLEAACLLMPSRSDHLLPIEDAEEMHRQIAHSRLEVIEGNLGHWAASQPPATPEYRQVQAATRAFLDEL